MDITKAEGPTRRAVVAAAGAGALVMTAGEAMAANELTEMGGAALARAIRQKRVSAREA